MNNNTSGQSATVSRGVQKEIHREYSETAPDSVQTSRLLRHHIRERECDGVRRGGRCVCWHHTSFASRGGAFSVWCGAGESSVRRLQPQDNEIPLDRCVCVLVWVCVCVCMHECACVYLCVRVLCLSVWALTEPHCSTLLCHHLTVCAWTAFSLHTVRTNAQDRYAMQSCCTTQLHHRIDGNNKESPPSLGLHATISSFVSLLLSSPLLWSLLFTHFLSFKPVLPSHFLFTSS